MSNDNAGGLRGILSLQDFVQDLRYGLRSIIRNPGFAAMHVLLIAMSIGLACSAFAVTDAVLLRSLPAITDPNRLVLVQGIKDNNTQNPFPLRAFRMLAGQREQVSHVFGFRSYGGLPTKIGDATIALRAIGVAGDYFGGLGRVPLVMGRVFDPDSDDAVLIINYGFWQQQFGGARDALGRSVTLGTTPFSIAGVARSDFIGTQPDLHWDVIAPFRPLDRARGLSPEATENDLIYMVARLRAGVSAKQYEASVDTQWPAILRATIPAGSTVDAWRARFGSRLVVQSLRSGLAFTLITTPGLSRALNLTVGLSILIFVASCLTLALLVVARGIRNQRYNAIKLALGGTRWRIIRPYIIESGIVSLLGCIVGLLIARWGSNLGASFVPGDWQIGVTPSVIGIAIGLAVATTLLGGILAAYVSSRSSIQEVLQQSNRTTQPHVTLRAGLLATQFAVSVVLVYSTLFYVDDLAGLTRADVGLDVKNLHVFELSGRLPRRELGNDYFQRLTSELKAVPGVESVGMSGGAPPLSFLRDLTEPVQSDDGREVAASIVCVFPGVFESWRTRRLTGRDLEWTDGPSALVTENLARRLYPNGDALARRIRTKTPPVRDLAIVGIVGNMAFNGPRLGMRNVVFMQCLERTHPWPSNFAVQIFIRSSRGLAEVGRDVSKVVDRIGIHFVYSMDDEEQFLAWSTDQERVLATVSSAFGGLILALTGVGLYAFCSYMLAFRNRELAIRAGLGASPRAIATALLRETIAVLTVGLIVGLGLTLALQRVMAGLIVDVGSMNIGNLLQAVLILFAMALAASVLPMMRALRIDLARALRVD